MAPKFGTSGLRGLVTELTPELVADHVRAFIAACDIGNGLCLIRQMNVSQNWQARFGSDLGKDL